ncbi:MAG: hypothetical protein A2096_08775 [Spirochaetes bacterium GWF1_41_5]|nr:MAG: hypothetical protein A2096_08775 [Spirochaetes bacterium GWF1_41_5]
MSLLEIKKLCVYFKTARGMLRAVDDISFTLEKGETLALVGESGSGKTMTSLAIMGLAGPSGIIPQGEIIFNGINLLALPYSGMRQVRGKKISMIFQEPMSSLNPVFTVGTQLAEALLAHNECSKAEARRRSIDMLVKTGIPEAEKRYDEYPHQLSGGMKQRVMIAMALLMNPEMVIADEPTTSLDVTIQAQIMELLKSMQNKSGISLLLISHDLSLVGEYADKVAVMYSGKICEYGTVRQVLENPVHPYTRGLLSCIPALHKTGERLKSIPGSVVPSYSGTGCLFRMRCPEAQEICKDRPGWKILACGTGCACHMRK